MTQAALKYINNEWTAMENVLKFGDAELSNNLCEQMMRHIKTNLKNSQNIGSEKCAGNFCFMYSLIESCQLNAISPIKYIS
ncbi:MAG: transposase, partial [Clostridia bacterium]|nr:transposase [Clostridia bacterium]